VYKTPKPPPQPSAAQVLAGLIAQGATDLLGIPDNASAALFDLASSDHRVRCLTVTREGEAFAVAAGLWLGGRMPVVSIQCTGLMESGDAIRGTAVRMGVPVLCLVGYRGYAKMLRAGIDPGSVPADHGELQRHDVDSAAVHLLPTLGAWAIPYVFLDPEREAESIRAAWVRARTEERPVAILLTAPLAAD
jgi:sulfopyruvate decarboxylase TPP-binding subunit